MTTHYGSGITADPAVDGASGEFRGDGDVLLTLALAAQVVSGALGMVAGDHSVDAAQVWSWRKELSLQAAATIDRRQAEFGHPSTRSAGRRHGTGLVRVVADAERCGVAAASVLGRSPNRMAGRLRPPARDLLGRVVADLEDRWEHCVETYLQHRPADPRSSGPGVGIQALRTVLITEAGMSVGGINAREVNQLMRALRRLDRALGALADGVEAARDLPPSPPWPQSR